MMTIVNNPGDWGHIFSPLEHAAWNGCTPTDLVFPFFIFSMGFSVNLSKPASLATIATRTLRIFLLGLFLNFFSKIHVGDWTGGPLLAVRLGFTILATIALTGKFEGQKQLIVALLCLTGMLFLAFGPFADFAHVRIPGVLQRIALVYACVALGFLYLQRMWHWVICLVGIVGYFIIMNYIPTPGLGTGFLAEGKNLAAYVDNLLLPGHLWAVSNTWDPEGILSTIPAISSGFIGLITGNYLLNHRIEWFRVALVGLVLIGLGLWMDSVFPINKALWSSSFVLFSGGCAVVGMAVVWMLVEVRQQAFLFRPLLIFGMHPMLVFFFSGIIPRVLSMLEINLYAISIEPHFSNPKIASLVGALTYVVIWFIVLHGCKRFGWKLSV